MEFRYRDLMLNFEQTLKARAQEVNEDASFPVTIGINAFRGFLDEFNKKVERKEHKPEVKEKKKKKSEKEHIYVSTETVLGENLCRNVICHEYLLGLEKIGNRCGILSV